MAIITGIIVSVLFLVPEAPVPTLAYLPATAGLVLIALLVVVVLAAVPVYLLFTSRSEHRVSEFAV